MCVCVRACVRACVCVFVCLWICEWTISMQPCHLSFYKTQEKEATGRATQAYHLHTSRGRHRRGLQEGLQETPYENGIQHHQHSLPTAHQGERHRPSHQKVRSGIHNIPCRNCDLTYIGETKTSLETYLKEHQAATK